MLCFRQRKEQLISNTVIDSSYVAFDIMMANGNPVSGAVALDEMLVFEFTGKFKYFSLTFYHVLDPFILSHSVFQQ